MFAGNGIPAPKGNSWDDFQFRTARNLLVRNEELGLKTWIEIR